MASLNPAKSNVYYSAADQKYHYLSYGDETYVNDDAIENLIHYVTRTGYRSDRVEDLICWGTSGICTGLSPDDCINHFKVIQERCRIDRNIGAKVAHEILSFSTTEEDFFIAHKDLIYSFANECALVYLKEGHICVFGVHYGLHEENITDLKAYEPKNKLHIHFAINAVNHITGNKLRSCIGSKAYHAGNQRFYRIPFDTKSRERKMNSLLYEYYMRVPNPYHCVSDLEYFNVAYPNYSSSNNQK